MHCFGDDRPGATGHRPAAELAGANAALTTLSVDLSMVAATGNVELLHSHTWYANMAGHIGKLLHGIPHVVTAHSLEPHRPWKAEQLGGGYRVSSWAEKTAYESADAIISVSTGMRGGILESYPALDPAKVHVIRNGIDTEIYQRHRRAHAADRQGRRPGRADRLVRRPDHPAEGRRPPGRRDPPVRPGRPAGAVRGRPGHPGDRRRDRGGHRRAAGAARPGVFWFDGMLTLARGQAGAVGVDGVRLPVGVRAARHRQPGGDGLRRRRGGQRRRRHPRGGATTARPDCWCTTTPTDGAGFERAIADGGERPGPRPGAGQRVRQGRAGARASTEFSWTAIAEQTVDLYRRCWAEPADGG